MHNPQQQKVIDFLLETSGIFNYVKLHVITIEKGLSVTKAPLHPANELRNIMFHLYDAINHSDNPKIVDENLFEAKEHLVRCFYDTHQILLDIYYERINKWVEKYENEIPVCFPTFWQDFKIAIEDCYEELNQIRATRNSDLSSILQDLAQFNTHLSVVTGTEKRFISLGADLIRLRQKNRRNKFWKGFFLALGIAIGVTGILLKLFLKK